MNAAHWCVASLAIGLVGGMAPVFLMPWDDPWSTVVLGIFVIIFFFSSASMAALLSTFGIVRTSPLIVPPPVLLVNRITIPLERLYWESL